MTVDFATGACFSIAGLAEDDAPLGILAENGTGRLATSIAEIVATGANVAFVGYYELPDGAEFGFDRCGEELVTLATRMADLLLEKGLYVIGFSYPVVPMGKARIRTQMSAAHSREDLEKALQAFKEAKEELGV